MKKKRTSLKRLPAWKDLVQHGKEIGKVHLRELFANDSSRGEKLTAEGTGLFLEYSKNRVTEATLKLLLRLAEECDLRGRSDAMFGGQKINTTEKRAVLHVALRASQGASIIVDGKNVVPAVHDVLDKMESFSNRIHNGEWVGHTG